jgi:hypothetical protein
VIELFLGRGNVDDGGIDVFHELAYAIEPDSFVIPVNAQRV